MEKNKLKLKQKRIADSISTKTRMLEGLEKESKKLISDNKKAEKSQKDILKQIDDDTAKAKVQRVKVKELDTKVEGAEKELEEIQLEHDGLVTNISSLNVKHDERVRELGKDYASEKNSKRKKTAVLDGQLKKAKDSLELAKVELGETSKKAESLELSISEGKKDLKSVIKSIENTEKDYNQLLADIKAGGLELDGIRSKIKTAKTKLSELQVEGDEAVKLTNKAIEGKEKAEKDFDKASKKLLSISDRKQGLDQRELILKEKYKQAGIAWN